MAPNIRPDLLTSEPLLDDLTEVETEQYLDHLWKALEAVDVEAPSNEEPSRPLPPTRFEREDPVDFDAAIEGRQR